MADSQLLPHDLDAERALLGALLLAPGTVTRAIGTLSPDDFYPEPHKILARAIFEVIGQHPDKDLGPGVCLMVAGHLEDTGQLNAVGGRPELVRLQAETPNTTGAAAFAARISEKARRRQMITDAKQQAVDARREPDFMTALAAARARLDAVVATSNFGRQLVTARQAGDALLDLLEQRQLGEAMGIPTGFPALDKLTGGLRPGQMWVAGARSSQGKTTLGVNMALEAAEAGHPVLVVSLEMDQNELMERFISRIGHLSYTRLRNSDPDQRIDQRTINGATAAVDHYAKLPITILDDPYVTPTQIAATARLAGIGDGRGLIVIDYLQLLNSDVPGQPETEALSGISTALVSNSRELRCATLALAQLRKVSGGAYDPNPVPTLEDLRGSGRIGHDAHVVLMIHRPNVDAAVDNGDFNLYVRKNRSGPRGKVELLFDPAHQTIRSRVLPGPAPRDPSAPQPRGEGASRAEELLARRATRGVDKT